MAYWLVKSEPDVYSWDDLVRDGSTVWSGVRNYQARNNLAAMKEGERVLFYHSQSTKDVVGVATVLRTAYPDPTIPEDPRWQAVDIRPVFKLKNSVTLEQFKTNEVLKESILAKHSRLSVMPISDAVYAQVMKLSGSTPE
jgi:predicted RNA-binding protein with PUA-like domain